VQSPSATRKGTQAAPLILSALNDELRAIVKSERPPAAVHQSSATGTGVENLGVVDGQGAPSTSEALVPVHQQEEVSQPSAADQGDPLLEDDLGLWEELGIAAPAIDGSPLVHTAVRDQDLSAAKPDRLALEERARSILRKDSALLATMATDASADAEDRAVDSDGWDDLGDGWDHAGHSEVAQGAHRQVKEAGSGAALGALASAASSLAPPAAGPCSGGSGGESSGSGAASARASLTADEDAPQGDDQLSASELRSRHQQFLDASGGGATALSWIDRPSLQDGDADESRASLLHTPDASFVGASGAPAGVLAVNFDLSGLKMSSESVGLGMRKLNECVYMCVY